MIYRTKQGDTLDLICFKFYGQASGYVEQVLEVNYRLSSHDEYLPAGLDIDLPELPEQAPAETMINLWD